MWPKLVAFGNVLLDFTYCISKNPEILSEYGFDPNGLGEFSSETLALVLENANKSCEFISSQTGGSALNTSKLLSLLGETENIFCGAIGNDVIGSIVRQQLEQAGLKTYLQVIDGKPTGKCVCLINKTDRCCYGNIAASIYFDKSYLLTQNIISPQIDLKSDAVAVAAAAKQIFYIEGFFITNGERFSLCKYIVDDICKPSQGLKPLAVNLSAEYMVKNHSEQMKYLVEHSNILFGNRNEFNQLADIYRMSNAKDVIAHLIKSKSNENSIKIIVCTQGADCVLYSTESHINKEFHFEPVPKNKIIDTTGCGDAFVAGFFYAYLRQESIEQCVGNGVQVALKKLTSVGGTISN